MSEVERELVIKQDEIINMYKSECELYREQLIEHKNSNEKTNFRIFVLSIVTLGVLCVITAILCISNIKIQNSFIDFMNQYEYTTSVETETVTVDQDASDGGDVGYIGGDGDISYGETESSESN